MTINARMRYLPEFPGTWAVLNDKGHELGTVTMTGLGYVVMCHYCDRIPVVGSTAKLAGQHLLKHCREHETTV